MTRSRIIEAARTVVALDDVDDWQPHHYDELHAAAEALRGEVDRYDRAEERKASGKARLAGRLAAAPKKRRTFTPDPPELTAAKVVVRERSGGLCEARTPVCDRTAKHVHHIARRKSKGCHAPELLLHVCQRCHDWIHANPEQSYDAGWLVRAGALPEVRSTKEAR